MAFVLLMISILFDVFYATHESILNPGSASDSDTTESSPHLDTDSALQEILKGGVAKIILKNALAALPTDLSLRKAFLGMLLEFDTLLSQGFEDRLCEELKQSFGKVILSFADGAGCM